MGGTRTRVEPAVTVEPVADACDKCPARSLARDASYGYCEGCASYTRRCPGCGRDRAQVGWSWGTELSGLVRWMCADCRWPAPPDEGVPEAHPRFTCQLDVDERGRYEVASALETAAAKAGGGEASWAIARMAASLRGGDGRTVDVDLRDVSLQARRDVDQMLARLWWDHPTLPALQSLCWRWSAHVAECVPPPAAPAPAPTPAQTARAVFGERPVS